MEKNNPRSGSPLEQTGKERQMKMKGFVEIF